MRWRARSSRSLQPVAPPRRSRSRARRAARSASRNSRAGWPSGSVRSASSTGTEVSTRSISPTTATQSVQGPELRVGDDGEISVTLNPDDARIRALRERRDCPGLVHIITAYVAQYAALDEGNARRVLRPGIVRDADPGLREHELYAYYYDRIDQPAVAHDEDGDARPTRPAPLTASS
jgi:hypothetical protein